MCSTSSHTFPPSRRALSMYMLNVLTLLSNIHFKWTKSIHCCVFFIFCMLYSHFSTFTFCLILTGTYIYYCIQFPSRTLSILEGPSYMPVLNVYKCFDVHLDPSLGHLLPSLSLSCLQTCMLYYHYPPPTVLRIKSFIFLPVHQSIVPHSSFDTLTFPLDFSTFFDVSRAYVILKTGGIC